MTGKRNTRSADLTQSGPLAVRKEGGHRSISLKKNEREYLRFRAKVERAVTLFLDIEIGRTWAEIASEMGISVPSLHDLTKTDEFNEIYNQFFADLGHDPRLKVSQQALADMVPLAVRTLREIIASPDASTASRVKAIEMVFKIGGIQQIQPKESDKTELQKFLLGKGINVEQVNVQLPPALQRAEDMLSGPPPDAVEAQVVEQKDEVPSDDLD